jgi:tyrosyl-tRNA synthetase
MTSPPNAAAREAAQAYADGCDHVETFDELAARIGTNRPLNVKLGLDPTTPDLHIGHAVVLRKLQQFVDGGHNVTLLIGDFTARIGDPTGRNTMRPPLTDEAIESNMVTYAKQAGKVLDMERVTLRYNSEWLGKLSFAQLIKLFAQTTVAQMLERNDFAQRYDAGTPISMHEFLYPVAQAYDSVALEADVELGGSDQLFNLLMGRPYQVHAGQVAQICMTVPLLEGVDGKKKMSKSSGNHIALTDAPSDQFGKLMRIPDEVLPRYARLGAGWSQAETERLAAALAAGAAVAMDEKKRIAEAVVTLYHGADAARGARDYFERTIQRGELPREMPERRFEGVRSLVEVVVAAGFAESKRAAQRLIAEGAVKIDGSAVTDPKASWDVTRPAVVQVGSRKFVRVLPEERLTRWLP